MSKNDTNMNYISKRGFTLIEALLVIGLLSLIAVLGIPFYQSFQTQSQLDSASLTILQALHTARIESLSGKNNTDHGVHIETHRIVSFIGSAYVPNDPQNFVVDLPNAITLSSAFGPDVIFARRTGEAQQTGTVSLSALSTTHTFSIHEQGTVDQIN